MSLLSKSTKGPIKKPFFLIIYGPPGPGKTTWCSKFPNPYFFAFEDGTNQLDVERYRIKTYAETIQLLNELINEKHDHKTLVWDSLDHSEILIWDQVCAENKVKNIGDIAYGGGYVQALAKWKEIGEKLKTLREKMNVLLIAHSTIKQINDPSLPMPYDKHVIKLHQKSADYLKESVEAIFFANYEIFVAKKDGDKSARAFGEGRRVLHTMASPSFEAKNRYSLPEQIEMRLETSYEDFIREVEKADSNDPLRITERIQHYIPQLKNEELRKNVSDSLAKVGAHIGELLRIEAKLKTVIETQ